MTAPDPHAGRPPPALARILAAARERPGHPALEVGGEAWTYAALVAAAASIAARLAPRRPQAPQPVTAVMAGRSAAAYAGILAARLAGHAWVPLNPAHPPARNARVLAASGAAQAIAGESAADHLDAVLRSDPVLAGRVSVLVAGERLADHPAPAAALADVVAAAAAGDDLAYILFTSGSTGVPKGVPVPAAALEAYLAAAAPFLDIRPDDRFSATFDLTFDLSVHDLFLSLSHGATLVVPSSRELGAAGAWARAAGITQWFAVPSLGHRMRLAGELVPGALPGLRRALFCGEVLPMDLARAFAAAAPNARIENWYGPTEATIACARHPVAGDEPFADAPIGRALPGMALHVVDALGRPLAPGTAGELWLSGPQLARGYLNDPVRTAEAFRRLADGTPAYRSGDRAVAEPDGTVRFLGRLDSQIKLRGYRIELGEVEAALRAAAGGANALAFPWPPGPGASALAAAVEAPAADAAAIREALAERLPDYMVPARLIALPAFPRNASGKADRAATAALLAAALAGPDPAALPEADGPAERLLAAIARVAPAVDPARARSAANLFEAGMDSLAFTALTLELEADFGVALDEARVVRLSELPFDAILADLAGRPAPPPGGLARLAGRLRALALRGAGVPKPRLNRAVQFARRFPAALAAPGPDWVLAAGSSGIFRGFLPEAFAAEAARLGVPCRAMNIGLPAITPEGLAEVARFVAATCRAQGVRPMLVLWELDPMHLSTTPPAGDIGLDARFLAAPPRPGPSLDPEFDWRPETFGAWNAAPTAATAGRRPAWVRDRDRLIARAYLGEIAFDAARLAAWQDGAAALAAAAGRLAVFVPPADATLLAEAGPPPAEDRLAALLAGLAQAQALEVIDWRAFDLGPGDFLDINHANAAPGRARLSRQLARLALRPGAAAGRGSGRPADA